MAVHDLTRIEEKLDRAAVGATVVSDHVGGVLFQSMSEVLEFSKIMALSDKAVPPHLRGNPGACLRIVTQALEWRMSPFAVADKSYFVNDKIAYESQLVHAIIEQRAPLEGRLRHRYEGEGDERVCIVTGKVKGEVEPLEYRSPPFGKITPKNSPLWKAKPDLQHYYNTSRDFCRVYFPDVLLGIYSRDEIEDAGEFTGSDRARDITPKPAIGERLKGSKGRGFSKEHVDKETEGSAASNPADGKAGEAARANTQAEPEKSEDASPADPLEELLDTKPEPEPDPRAAAFNAGEAARDAGKPLQSVPEQFKKEMTLSDAYQDGWRDRDKQMAEKAA